MVVSTNALKCCTTFLCLSFYAFQNDARDGEQALIKEHEIGLLGPLCDKYRQSGKLDNSENVEYAFDLMLLDAGEFTGWAEFQVAMSKCKPKYIALHDTQAFKHWFTVQELLKDSSGYEAFDLGFDQGGTGHAVFKRVH